MIPNLEFGKIYDTLFFFTVHFNKADTLKELQRASGSSDFVLNHVNTIEGKFKEIPSLLMPFFCPIGECAAPLSCFFFSEANLQCISMESFLLSITEKSDVLFRRIMESLFVGDSETLGSHILADRNSVNCVEALSSLKLPLELKLQIALLNVNFSYAVSLLIQWIREIYLYIDGIHKDYSREIQMEFEKIQGSANLHLYTNLFNWSANKVMDSVVSISVLNPSIVSEVERDQVSMLLLGIYHEPGIIDRFSEDKLTARNFILSCGNETRYAIIDTLIKHKELTASQIAKIIGVPPTTMTRNLTILSENGIIYIARHDKLQIFYRLNVKVLRRIKVDIDDMFSGFLDS